MRREDEVEEEILRADVAAMVTNIAHGGTNSTITNSFMFNGRVWVSRENVRVCGGVRASHSTDSHFYCPDSPRSPRFMLMTEERLTHGAGVTDVEPSESRMSTVLVPCWEELPSPTFRSATSFGSE